MFRVLKLLDAMHSLVIGGLSPSVASHWLGCPSSPRGDIYTSHVDKNGVLPTATFKNTKNLFSTIRSTNHLKKKLP